MEKSEVLKKKDSAITRIDDFLSVLINDGKMEHLKKVGLISNWLKEYTRYIEFEEKFLPNKNIAYKRGNVLKVNFGFNVGSEFGGMHYAVVIDKKNQHNSPVITVVPLTSKNKEHITNVDIGSDLYASVYQKASNMQFQLVKRGEELIRLRDAALELIRELKTVDTNSEEFISLFSDSQVSINAFENLNRDIKKETNYLARVTEEISHMKSGTTALVSQIRTVSKMRIYDPRVRNDVLHNVSLSADSMELINKKIQELYVF